ncbi:MAG: PQ-loop repeat-containing protein [Luteimonas sp.]|nr:PQ-loop repeat-containing protein [Luteimonas sp.]
MIDAIGWIASAILLATLIRQIVKQAQDGDAEGVSTWLFLGQATASALFVVYSLLLENWVFTTTNSLILATAIAGQWLTRRKRKATTAP